MHMNAPAPTLVLPPRYTPDSITLWRAAEQLGWHTERLQSWRVPEWLANERIVVYGEPLFVAVLASELSWSFIEPRFDWLPQLPIEYTCRDLSASTLVEAQSLTTRSFIKPADDKCFVAGIYESGQELSCDDMLPANTPVIISEPVVWASEFRCFILNREIQTYSPYLRFGELAIAEDGTWPIESDELDELEQFTKKFLADPQIELPSSVVVDFGYIEDIGWAVIEANAAWGSGIYGCDPIGVLKTIERSCIPTAELKQDDRKWIVERS